MWAWLTVITVWAVLGLLISAWRNWHGMGSFFLLVLEIAGLAWLLYGTAVFLRWAAVAPFTPQ